MPENRGPTARKRRSLDHERNQWQRGLHLTMLKQGLRIVSVHSHADGDGFAFRALDDKGQWYALKTSFDEPEKEVASE